MEKRHSLLAFALAFGLTTPLRAEAGRTTSQPLVILSEDGTDDVEKTAFFSSVRALAAEIGISVSAQKVPSLEAIRDTLLAQARQESKPFLVAWILREKGMRKIHLFDPWKNQLRTRTIEAGESATANGETLALILHAELLAFLSETTPTPPPTPPSPPPTPLPPAPRPPPRWALAASYVTGTFLRDQGLQQGLGLSLAHRWSRVYLGARYTFVSSQDVHAEDVSLTVHRHPFDLSVGLALPEHHRLHLAMEAFMSGDAVSRHTSSAGAPLSAQPDDRRFLLGAGLRGRVEVRILRNLAVHLALGAEAPLNPYDFQVVQGTTSTTAASLSPARISGEVGVILLAL